MTFRALRPEDFRKHQFEKHGRTDRVSFVLRCVGCGWESPRCWDDEDMRRAKHKHLMDLDLVRLVKLNEERAKKRADYHANGRNAQRRAKNGVRRSGDGQTQEKSRERPRQASGRWAKAEAGVGSTVPKSEAQAQGPEGRTKSRRSRRKHRAQEVRQEANGQDGREGPQAEVAV